MAFIGNSVTTQGFTPAIDYFSGNGSTVTFTLSRPVASVASIIVTVDNVVQNSGASAYTVSGNSITFSSAPLSGTNNIWVQYTSPITQTLGLTQDPSVVGDMTLTGGVYAVGDFGSGYSDGTIMDYVTGNGRITVGPSDDLTFYHGGYYSRSALMTLSYAGNSTLYNNLSITGALTVATKLNLPTWTTATRPASPSTGTTGYNTTTAQIEVYNSTYSSWVNAGTSGITYAASYLVVAGGGAGGGGSGANGGGGGGAGGLLTGSTTLYSGVVYTATVGSGGAGGSGAGASGGTSSLTGGSVSISAVGGGGGGAYGLGGVSGGSGGGSGRDAGAIAAGSGTSGQGYAGGLAGGASFCSGGGGGGAGGTGYQGGVDSGTRTGTLAQGGVGVASSITGSSVYYAGGGGGAWQVGSSAASGGNGGGGSGSANSGGVAPTAGTANTGGGGGGSQGSTATPSGGSGVVIISVPTANYTGTTTGSPTVTTSGSNTVIKFTSSGTYTA